MYISDNCLRNSRYSFGVLFCAQLFRFGVLGVVKETIVAGNMFVVFTLAIGCVTEGVSSGRISVAAFMTFVSISTLSFEQRGAVC